MPFKPVQPGAITTDDSKNLDLAALVRSKAATEEAVRAKATEVDVSALEEERVYRGGVVSVRDLIAPAAFKVDPNVLHLGDLVVRTIYVVTYPRYINIGWFSPIINMNVTADMAMYFYPIKAEVILKQLKKKVGTVTAEINAAAEKGAPRDPAAETAIGDVERLRDSLTQGTEHFFQFALYVTIYGKSAEDIDKISEQVESVFASSLIYTRRAIYQTEQGFNATLPLANDEIAVAFNMNSSPIASSFPFVSSDLTSDNGILYGINRHNNSLILFDRFSLPNANGIVFATSGAGKSYAVKLEILRTLMMGVDVICIDPEMEYKNLSDAVGGTFINLSLASESKLNPFDLPRPTTGDASTEDIIRSAVITTKSILRIMLGTFTTEEDSLIDRALIETYAKKDITTDTDLTKLGPTDMPILSDLQNILDGMTGSKDVVERLKKYTEGTFSGLLNAYTNVSMNNQFVVFSVRDLEDELRPLGIFTIVNYIWNVVRSERKKRVLVIDEAWWLMQHEDSARFIFTLAKRCRKYYLGITTITQDVADFLGSQYGRAIVTNSQMQLLLKQSTAAVDKLVEVFMLTQGEKSLLLESGIGEGIFFAGPRHAAIKIVASYTEDKLVTTNPEQLLGIDKSKKAFREMVQTKEAVSAPDPAPAPAPAAPAETVASTEAVVPAPAAGEPAEMPIETAAEAKP